MNVELPKQPDLILIDDNKSLTRALEMQASLVEKKLAVFNGSRSFRENLHRYDKILPIYIDSDLHEAITGEEFAKELYDLGFKNLYLITGYDVDAFGKMPWIKKILSKDAPLW